MDVVFVSHLHEEGTIMRVVLQGTVSVQEFVEPLVSPTA